MSLVEFDLISRIKAHAGVRADVILGIGDDAALLQVPAGQQLVVTTDTLNVGVHFFAETAAADIGWKSLAVNLSDLAAMGAVPVWCTLSLSLPKVVESWVDGFLKGFTDLAQAHGVALVGGDTTCGTALSISVTAMGLVAQGLGLRRGGAQLGDDIWVTGTIGDAAAALSVLLDGSQAEPVLFGRLNRPSPRVSMGKGLLSVAHSCIDVSDGLMADLGHICKSSGLGARLELACLPASVELSAWQAQQRWAFQLGGGDDYELCFTASKEDREAIGQIAQACDTPVAVIGEMVAGTQVLAIDGQGQLWSPPRAGYVHFMGGDEV